MIVVLWYQKEYQNSREKKDLSLYIDFVLSFNYIIVLSYEKMYLIKKESILEKEENKENAIQRTV